MAYLFRPEVVEHRASRLHGTVQLSQPLPVRLTAIGIAVIFVGIAVLLVFGTYSRTEAVQGVLVTDRPSPKISATLTGILADLPVREGMIVKKGQKLAVIAMEHAAEDGQASASVGIVTIDARIAMNSKMATIKRQKYLAERRRLSDVIASSTAEIASLDAQIKLQQQVVASSRELFTRANEAIGRGFVSKVELEGRREHMIQAEQALEGLRQQQLTQNSQREQARAQLEEVANDIDGDTVDIASGTQALKQQRAELQTARSYEILAPEGGRVTAVRSNIGNVVNASSPIMSIVPDNATLQAEVYVPSRAIGFVRPGQEARLEYDAFPFQRFGSAKGRIMSISRSIIDPRESLIPVKAEEPVYKVVIALERQSVLAFGQRYPLQPGMALRANLILERQSFLDWLLSPMRAVRSRA